jgi:hypothetical protein
MCSIFKGKMFFFLEIEFLDINLTKDSSLLLHAIHSFSTGGFLKKTRFYYGFANKKIFETRKLESIRQQNFVERKNEDRKPEKTRVYAQKPRLKTVFKNSISDLLGVEL